MTKTFIVKQGHFTVKKYSEDDVTYIRSNEFIICTAFSFYNSDLKIGGVAHFDLIPTANSIEDIGNKIIKNYKDDLEAMDTKVVFNCELACGTISSHSPDTRILIKSNIAAFNTSQNLIAFEVGKEHTFYEKTALYEDVIFNLDNGSFKPIPSTMAFNRFWNLGYKCNLLKLTLGGVTTLSKALLYFALWFFSQVSLNLFSERRLDPEE